MYDRMIFVGWHSSRWAFNLFNLKSNAMKCTKAAKHKLSWCRYFISYSFDIRYTYMCVRVWVSIDTVWSQRDESRSHLRSQHLANYCWCYWYWYCFGLLCYWGGYVAVGVAILFSRVLFLDLVYRNYCCRTTTLTKHFST